MRLEAPVEHMATSVVARIESLCIEPVQPVHAVRKGLSARFEEQVVVGRHQAVRVTDPQKRVCASRQLPDEVAAIRVIAEEDIATHRPRRYMKETVLQVTSWASRHGEWITGLPLRPRRRLRVGTKS